jgi:hypothetical protein
MREVPGVRSREKKVAPRPQETRREVEVTRLINDMLDHLLADDDIESLVYLVKLGKVRGDKPYVRVGVLGAPDHRPRKINARGGPEATQDGGEPAGAAAEVQDFGTA